MSKRPCPCGSGSAYASCCERYIRGKQRPETAEKLMRSRYTAYVTGAVDYLVATRHPSFRSPSEAADITAFMMSVTTWDNLEILIAESGEKTDAQGLVAFNVFFHQGSRAESFYECSRFSIVDGEWMYEAGEIG